MLQVSPIFEAFSTYVSKRAGTDDYAQDESSRLAIDGFETTMVVGREGPRTLATLPERPEARQSLAFPCTAR